MSLPAAETVIQGRRCVVHGRRRIVHSGDLPGLRRRICAAGSTARVGPIERSGRVVRRADWNRVAVRNLRMVVCDLRVVVRLLSHRHNRQLRFRQRHGLDAARLARRVKLGLCRIDTDQHSPDSRGCPRSEPEDHCRVPRVGQVQVDRADRVNLLERAASAAGRSLRALKTLRTLRPL